MSTTYTAERLYTGLEDAVIAPGAVTVDGETISYVGPASDAPTTGEQVALGDVTLMPGLIDMHVHLTFSASLDVLGDYTRDSDALKLIRGVEHARHALLAGITTVRECGGQNAHVFALREASERRMIAAPRIIAAGGALTTTGGHCWFFGLEADTEDELRRAVRAQSKAGADYVKVMATGGSLTPRTSPWAAQYSGKEMRAIVDEADRLGLRVAAHCHGTPGIVNAARARVTTIEHCSFLTPEGVVYDEDAAQLVLQSGCYVCPTIAIAERRARGLPPEHPLRQTKERMDGARADHMRRLFKLGVPLISGSDAGVTLTPIEDFAFNLTLLVERVGLPPHEALITATSQAAAALGRDDLGRLAPGCAADVIAVRGNPLEEIGALWHVELVVARGTRYR